MEGGYFSSALAGLLSKLGSQAEEISLLIQKQSSARAAIRLELFLPPQLKPTKIPDPLDRQEVGGSLETHGGGGPVPRHTLATAPLPAAEAC